MKEKKTTKKKRDNKEEKRQQGREKRQLRKRKKASKNKEKEKKIILAFLSLFLFLVLPGGGVHIQHHSFRIGAVPMLRNHALRMLDLSFSGGFAYARVLEARVKIAKPMEGRVC